MLYVGRLLLAVALALPAMSLAADTPAAAAEPVCWSDHLPGPVPCQNGFGWTWNDDYECWFYLPQPDPPPTYEPWTGHWPSGDVHWGQCIRPYPWTGYDQSAWPGWVPPPYGQGQEAFGALWLPGGPSPEELGEQAMDALEALILDPVIDTAPPPGAFGFVGLTMWLWSQDSPETWGVLTTSASGGGITVTATAEVSEMTWEMGDGSSVVCDVPGTPYPPGLDAASPDCGYIYLTTSAGQPDLMFTVTATSHWELAWTGPGGTSGSRSVDRSSSVPAQVGEVQSIVEYGP